MRIELNVTIDFTSTNYSNELYEHVFEYITIH